MPPLPGPLFVNAPAEVIDTMRRSGTIRQFAVDQTIFHEEDPADQLILLLEGNVRVWRTSARGAAMTVHLMTPGALPGCAAVFRRVAYLASATAITPVTVLTWPAERARQLLEQHAVLALNAIGIIAVHTEEMLQRLHEVSTQPVEQRVARAMIRLLGDLEDDGAERIVPLSRQALAELSATTLHTVSRLISRWEARDIVRGGRGRVHVRRRGELAKLAEGEGVIARCAEV